PPSGCTFHPRCSHAKPVCSEKLPELREVQEGHYSACLFAEEFF
ncbi:oligopeptide/dipeptide ABC transporter ATP-binding protein, partial [Thermodesulfobacteriota bacterium]